MHKIFYRELDLNKDSLDNREVLAAKPINAKGKDLVKIINANPGIKWLSPEKVDLDTIKLCCEEIIARDEKGSVQPKVAKSILRMLKKPRSYSRTVIRKQPKRRRI